MNHQEEVTTLLHVKWMTNCTSSFLTVAPLDSHLTLLQESVSGVIWKAIGKSMYVIYLPWIISDWCFGIIRQEFQWILRSGRGFSGVQIKFSFWNHTGQTFILYYYCRKNVRQPQIKNYYFITAYLLKALTI